jgi:hypothetical protein
MTEQQFDETISKILASVENGEYSKEDAEFLLREIEKSALAVKNANREIIGRNIAIAIGVLKQVL